MTPIEIIDRKINKLLEKRKYLKDNKFYGLSATMRIGVQITVLRQIKEEIRQNEIHS